MKKFIYLVVFILLVQNTIKLNAQDFYSLNLPYALVEKSSMRWVNFYEDLYNKKKYSARKFKYKIDSGEIIKENGIKKRFLSFSYVIYKTPHIDFSNYFYFNENNLCDSIVFYENVCLDCARKENDQFLFWDYEHYVKISSNEYETSFFESYEETTRGKIKTRINRKKINYVRLSIDHMPITGECRKWTFTLKEGLVYPNIKYPKRI